MKLRDQLGSIQDETLPLRIMSFDTDQEIEHEQVNSVLDYYVRDLYPLDSGLTIWVSKDTDNERK